MIGRKRRSSEHRIRVQVETLDLTPPVSTESTDNIDVPSTTTTEPPSTEETTKQSAEQNIEQQKRIYARKRTCCGPRVFSSYEPLLRNELSKQVSETCASEKIREVESVVVVQDVLMSVPAESLTSNPTVTNEEAVAEIKAKENSLKTIENLIENSGTVVRKGINKILV